MLLRAMTAGGALPICALLWSGAWASAQSCTGFDCGAARVESCVGDQCARPALQPAEVCEGQDCDPDPDACIGENCPATPAGPAEECSGQDCDPEPVEECLGENCMSRQGN